MVAFSGDGEGEKTGLLMLVPKVSSIFSYGSLVSTVEQLHFSPWIRLWIGGKDRRWYRIRVVPHHHLRLTRTRWSLDPWTSLAPLKTLFK